MLQLASSGILANIYDRVSYSAHSDRSLTFQVGRSSSKFKGKQSLASRDGFAHIVSRMWTRVSHHSSRCTFNHVASAVQRATMQPLAALNDQLQAGN